MSEKNILIIKLGALGDLIQQLDWVWGVYKKYPDAHFTFMTTKPYVSIVKCLPFVSEIIVDTRPRYNLKEWWKTCKQGIADRKWDYIFDLQKSKRTNKKYFGLVRFFSKHNVPWVYLRKNDLFLKMVEKRRCFSLGKVTETPFDLKPSEHDVSFIKGEQKNFHLLPKAPFLLVIPGCSASNSYKRWPSERYLEIVLRAEKKGVPAVILGTNAESQEIEAICKNSKAISFQNKASMLDIPALALKSAVIIGNDTGPVHLSSFTKQPTVILFRKKNSFVACNLPNITNLIAQNVTDISVDEVWNVVEKHLEGKSE